MSSEKKKQKRRNRAKMKNSATRGSKAAGRKFIPISICPTHGVYTQKELCPCYDSNGMLHGAHTYQEDFEKRTGISLN
jgi:ribosomal protein L32